MQLSQLSIGQKARIVHLGQGEKVYRQRLIAMGLLPGTELYISRIAPLADPIEITVRGYALSLRKGEANIVTVERIP